MLKRSYMKKDKVTFVQFIAGALLKFGEVDSTDLTLLIDKFYDNVEFVCDDGINDYFVLVGDKVKLNEEYVDDNYLIGKHKLLEELQGITVKRHMRSLNISEFVLRKIKLLDSSCIVKNEIKNVFSDIQLHFFDNLYQREFIEDFIYTDEIFGNYKSIRITQRGKLALFLIDNCKDVDSFHKFLGASRYSKSFINNFLMMNDLDKSCSEILSIENFERYCCSYEENFSVYENSNYSRKKIIDKKKI